MKRRTRSMSMPPGVHWHKVDPAILTGDSLRFKGGFTTTIRGHRFVAVPTLATSSHPVVYVLYKERDDYALEFVPAGVDLTKAGSARHALRIVAEREARLAEVANDGR